jgi:hypothetical protein
MEVYFTGIHMTNHIQLLISPSVIYLAFYIIYSFVTFNIYHFTAILNSYNIVSPILLPTFSSYFDNSFRSLSFTVHCFFSNFTLSDFRFLISPLHPSHLSCPCFLIAKVATSGPHKVNFGQKPFRVHYSWNQETKSHASREPNPRVHHSGQVTCSLCRM